MRPRLDGSSWLGQADAYGTTFIVELFASRQHPGYYHYAMYCTDDTFCEESNRPTNATDEASFWTWFELSISTSHGLAIDDLRWVEVSPEQLPLSGERVKNGA